MIPDVIQIDTGKEMRQHKQIEQAKWGYTTFSVADWNEDSHADIIFNSIHGKIGLLLNFDGQLRHAEIDSGVEVKFIFFVVSKLKFQNCP